MQVAGLRLILSPAARKMQADGRALGHQVGLEWEKVSWGLVTDRQSQAPYALIIHVRSLCHR